MSRRAVNSPPVKHVRWFHHVASDLVDVFPNAEGEFVQVWSAPSSDAERYVTLSYLRTPEGPVSVQSRIQLKGTAWGAFTTTGPRRTYYYLDDTHDYRYEEILPSGGLIVQDSRQGMSIRRVYTVEFDWEKRLPKGKPLGDRAVLRLQAEGRPWYVSMYQDNSSGSSDLCLVEEHLGHEFRRAVEPVGM